MLSCLPNAAAASVKMVWAENCYFSTDSCKFQAEKIWLLKMLILPVTFQKWKI